MKKLSIHNLTISVNNEKINIIYLENKLEKYYLYFPINNNLNNIDNNNFQKLEFNENVQITPKKKMNDLKLIINYNSYKSYSKLLYNNNDIYYVKEIKNINANHPDLKLMLENGKLYNKNKEIISNSNDIVSQILSKSKNNDNINIKNIDTDAINEIEFKITKINNKSDEIPKVLIESSEEKAQALIDGTNEEKTEVLIKSNDEIPKVSIETSEEKAEHLIETTKEKSENLIESSDEIPKVLIESSEEKAEHLIETNEEKTEVLIKSNDEIPKVLIETIEEKTEYLIESTEGKTEVLINENNKEKSEPLIDKNNEEKNEHLVNISKLETKENNDKEVFNLENILIDFNKLFQFIKKDDDKSEKNNFKSNNEEIKSTHEEIKISNVRKNVEDNKNVNVTIKNNIKNVNQEIKTNIKEYNIFNLKINYQNLIYKISAIKLEQSNNLNMLNLYKQQVPESNIIYKNNLSFILENNNSSYLVLFMNMKILINKIGNSIVFTNLANRNSQILKNKDNFKIGNDDFIVYNDCTLIIPVNNQKIFDNNYGTSYNLYIPRN